MNRNIGIDRQVGCEEMEETMVSYQLQRMLFVVVSYQCQEVINIGPIRDSLRCRFHGHEDMVSISSNLPEEKSKFYSLRRSIFCIGHKPVTT
jgi:hypothetical protein